jgi:hypothetical protein
VFRSIRPSANICATCVSVNGPSSRPAIFKWKDLTAYKISPSNATPSQLADAVRERKIKSARGTS